MSLGAIGAALGPVVGGTLDYFSAREQNQAADDRARASMDFSAVQAAKQMDFQERMSGSAHQREVEDLRKAGLNPLLSVNAGASSPAGASGSGAMAPVVPELGALATGAKDVIRLMNDWRMSSANVESAKAAALSSRASAKKAGVETGLLEKKGPEASVESRVYGWFDKLLSRVSDFSAKAAGEGPWKPGDDQLYFDVK